jgi:hypothetical protein
LQAKSEDFLILTFMVVKFFKMHVLAKYRNDIFGNRVSQIKRFFECRVTVSIKTISGSSLLASGIGIPGVIVIKPSFIVTDGRTK